MIDLGTKKRVRVKQKPIETLENGQIVYAKNAKGEPICNSPMRKKPGRLCMQSVGLFKNGRCELHGGKSPGGIEFSSFKNGLTSKYAPVLKGRLADAVARANNREDVLSLRGDIALTSGRIELLLTEYGDLHEADLRSLGDLAEEGRDLLAGEYDADDLEDLLTRFMTEAERLETRAEKGRALERSQEHLRRMIETENKRIQGEQDQLPAARAWVLFEILKQSVRIHVWGFLVFLKNHYPEVLSDPRRPDVLRGIAADVEKMKAKPANGSGGNGATIEGTAIVRQA